jgi:hypothetical protein
MATDHTEIRELRCHGVCKAAGKPICLTAFFLQESLDISDSTATDIMQKMISAICDWCNQ